MQNYFGYIRTCSGHHRGSGHILTKVHHATFQIVLKFNNYFNETQIIREDSSCDTSNHSEIQSND